MNNKIKTKSINKINDIKMKFIFNALEDGWTITKLNNGNYELTKEINKVKKEIDLNQYITTYL